MTIDTFVSSWAMNIYVILLNHWSIWYVFGVLGAKTCSFCSVARTDNLIKRGRWYEY